MQHVLCVVCDQKLRCVLFISSLRRNKKKKRSHVGFNFPPTLLIPGDFCILRLFESIRQAKMSDDIDAIWAEMRAESTYKKPMPNNLSSCQRDKHKVGNSNGLFKLQGGYGTAQSAGGGQPKKKGGTVTDFSWLQNYGIKQVAPPSSSSSSGVVKKTAASVGASSAAWTPITAASGNYGGSSSDPDGISTTTDAESGSRRGEAAEDDPNGLNFEPIAESVPLDSPEAFLAHFQRDLNILSDESTTSIDLKTRLRAVKKLELVVVKNVDALSSDILDCAQEELLKPLLKRIQRDSSEKIRELSAQILTKLVENAPNPLTSHGLNFVIPILVSRLGCEDLDGVAHLPPVMRPNPEQRPVEIQTPVEPSEEVRRTLAELIEGIVQRISTQQVDSFNRFWLAIVSRRGRYAGLRAQRRIRGHSKDRDEKASEINSCSTHAHFFVAPWERSRVLRFHLPALLTPPGPLLRRRADRSPPCALYGPVF